jgi:hypothetical protein
VSNEQRPTLLPRRLDIRSVTRIGHEARKHIAAHFADAVDFDSANARAVCHRADGRASPVGVAGDGGPPARRFRASALSESRAD